MVFGQEVAQVAEAKQAGILVPAAAQQQLPEDVAWDMLAAEGGVLGVVGAVVVAALWRVLKGILEETRVQNSKLVEKQSEAIAALKESLADVKTAIQVSDSNNQHALRHLGEVVSGAIQRLDRHEEKLGDHHTRLVEAHHRIAYLERGAPAASGVRPLSPEGRSIT